MIIYEITSFVHVVQIAQCSYGTVCSSKLKSKCKSHIITNVSPQYTC